VEDLRGKKQGQGRHNTTAALRHTTRRDYRKLLDQQVLPAFAGDSLAGIDALAVREWVAELVAGGCRPGGLARSTRCSVKCSPRQSRVAG
jgi:hypothetical protein